jgi:heat shock protein HspQ
LKFRIGHHYLQEAQLMADMINSNLSKDEIDELQDFMSNSAYSKFIDWINQKVQEKP